MCTFKITNYKSDTNDKMALGGPDVSNSVVVDGLYITHNLLQVTGEQTVQPVESKGLHYLLLGEVYNYDTTLPSDIYYVIKCYEKYGDNFLEHLDGEFLIIIIDSGVIKFFTDPWGTRQAWMHKEWDNFYFGTYPITQHRDFKIENNSQYNFDIKNQKLVCVNSEIHKWNLNQFKDTLDDVTIALEEAIDKRYHPKSFLLFSGGLDSAVIALRLSDTKKHIKSGTLNYTNAEDMETHSQVMEYCKNYHDNKIFYSPENKPSHVTEEIQLYYKQYCKVMLMGNGSDEIFCNYMNKPKVSKQIIGCNFMDFPDDLTEVFPWVNFYKGRHEWLIHWWEHKALSDGLEVRSIFLDKKLVQEWLNLSVHLKNKEHKYFLKEYLRNRNIKIPNSVAGLPSQMYWKL